MFGSHEWSSESFSLLLRKSVVNLVALFLVVCVHSLCLLSLSYPLLTLSFPLLPLSFPLLPLSTPLPSPLFPSPPIPPFPLLFSSLGPYTLLGCVHTVVYKNTLLPYHWITLYKSCILIFFLIIRFFHFWPWRRFWGLALS